MRNRIILFLIVSVIALAAAGVSAQTKVRVHFPRGATSTTVSGTVSGFRYIDYTAGARAGQTMSLKLTSASEDVQFVLFDPSMDNVEGVIGEVEWTGELQFDGTYSIRVLLPRSAARRPGSSARFKLSIAIY